jgi:hypothetical protein
MKRRENQKHEVFIIIPPPLSNMIPIAYIHSKTSGNIKRFCFTWYLEKSGSGMHQIPGGGGSLSPTLTGARTF